MCLVLSVDRDPPNGQTSAQCARAGWTLLHQSNGSGRAIQLRNSKRCVSNVFQPHLCSSPLYLPPSLPPTSGSSAPTTSHLPLKLQLALLSAPTFSQPFATDSIPSSGATKAGKDHGRQSGSNAACVLRAVIVPLSFPASFLI